MKKNYHGTTISIPRHVAPCLKYYVYVCVDPRNNQVFYVGKGRGKRVLWSLMGNGRTDCEARIEKINKGGYETRYEILAHRLEDEETALLIERAVIDAFGLEVLTNKVKGRHSIQLGRTPLHELVARYAAKPVKITHPVLLIRINRLYRPTMSADELYDATRGIWKIGLRRERAKFALAVFEGVVREVYEINHSSWQAAPKVHFKTGIHTLNQRALLNQKDRWAFTGRVADNSVGSKYRGRSVEAYCRPGNRHPVLYINV
jgi:hypothetical protein